MGEVSLLLLAARDGDRAAADEAFALAARAMRQLVVDHARQRAAAKRGGGIVAQDLDEIAERVGALGDAERMLGLDQALTRLAALDRELVTLVEMRFFAGLELDEIASITGRSERSLKRDWRKARAVLHATLGDGPAGCAVDG